MSKFHSFIVSYLPFDSSWPVSSLIARRKNFHRQLEWWMTATNIPIHALLSGWTDVAVASDPVLPVFLAAGHTYSRVPAQTIAANRLQQIQAFYASDADWGIIMDDDAILYDGPQHNRGPLLFSQMSKNGLAAYNGVDVFFPINPQKIGFNPIWEKDPPLYTNRHVFERNSDLKGSMFVMRNLRKEGKPEVLPDPTFAHIGEDRQFALEAVAMGYSVMRCDNIVLREFSAPSHFGSGRVSGMRLGYADLANRYAAKGLAIRSGTNRLDLKAFWGICWGTKATKIVV